MGDIRDFDHCLHGKTAPCSSVCPFSLDVREMVSKLQRGSFGPAYNLYRNAVAFPALASRLCSAPCGEKCAQRLQMRQLERSAIAFSRNQEPARLSVPDPGKRVAVVGASLGGLACALRLAQKRYDVTILEAESLPGGSVREVLPWDVIEGELKLQFQHAPCRYIPLTRITEPEKLASQYDAVYLASGTGFSEEKGNLFSDGTCQDTMAGLAAGLNTYQKILWYLQTGTRKKEEPACHPSGGFQPEGSARPVIPAQVGAYTKAEARQEALRCTKCDCRLCIDHCVLLQQYGQSPLDLARDVGVSQNLFHETQGHAAMREIGSCTDCGLCAQVCPVGIDIGAVLLKARQTLLDKGELPQAHHEYWLRDMAFANGPEAAVCHLPEGGICDYLFFPGCQSGGSDPRYVSMTYERLRSVLPNVGLLLRCCGAPALWAGDKSLFRQLLNQIRDLWLEAGKPVVILSCPSCLRTFRTYLPEIPTQTLYELPVLKPAGIGSYESAAVFDPCASRGNESLQQAVRKIARECNVELKPLMASGDAAQCCSWGGHGYCVNPLFVNQQVKQQIGQSDVPYICYCTNCRDIFAAKGKDCRHILDDILGINGGSRPSPTVTMRRENRRILKKALASRYGLPMEAMKEIPNITLYTSPAVAEKLSADLILEEDLCQVIANSEASGHQLINPQTGHRIAHWKIGYLTYWVEFSCRTDGGYEIHNAYTHRMTIKHEEM